MLEAQRLFDLPHLQLKKYPNEKMFVSKINGEWIPLSTADFLEKAMGISRGLIAQGIEPGDKVAIVSPTRYEWNVVDIAIQQVNGVVVPIYPNISSKDYEYIFNDATIKLCFVADQEILDKILHAKGNMRDLRHIYTFEKCDGADNWDKIIEAGQSVEKSAVEERMTIAKIEDLATIIYTSGTTGNPKGVMLSHKNILSNVEVCIDPIPADQNSRVLTFLPLCHIFERMLHYLYMYLGCSIYFAESMDTIGDNIREVKPHVFTAVPRLIEKVFDKIMAKGDELSGIKRSLFFWAVDLAEKYDPVNRSRIYKMKLGIARKLIFSKWQEALGGEVRAMASGSAALQPRLARIFLAADIPILEGYGLTETSPVVSVNCFKKGIRVGTVGPLIEGVEVKIAGDGEILVKGPNVMMGYYNQPEETAEVIKDGWFHTGDIGEFQEDKFLKITDRKKEIFKTSGGKYIIPQAMENKFKESRFIEQIVVVGESQKFPAAIVVPNFEFVREWAKRKGHHVGKTNEELINSKVVIDRIQLEIDTYNEQFGQWEQLKKFVMLPAELTVENDELTPTLKLKRKNIHKRYQEQIESIYANA
jgi:long-chain acyl-CoA synthetase